MCSTRSCKQLFHLTEHQLLNFSIIFICRKLPQASQHGSATTLYFLENYIYTTRISSLKMTWQPIGYYFPRMAQTLNFVVRRTCPIKQEGNDSRRVSYRSPFE